MTKTVFIVGILTSLMVLFSLTITAQTKKMILVEGGSFMMGNNLADGKTNGDLDEKPAHKVTLNSFYICEHELTVKEYREYVEAVKKSMPNPPNEEWMNSHIDTKKYYVSSGKKWWGWNDLDPIHNVTWYEAVDYCNWLSKKEGLQQAYYKNEDDGWDLDLTKNGYRLPTEAEWEFAARGGNKSKGFKYSGSNNIKEVAWFDDNTGLSGPQTIKTKKPNELGIYDMSGNVWEWCSDYYKASYYSSCPENNPMFSVAMGYRITRGGSWHYQGEFTTVTSRDGPKPAFSNYNFGFRLVRSKM